MANGEYKITKRQEQIEKLAEAIAFGSLSVTKMQIAKARLANLLFEEVNGTRATELDHPERGILKETFDGECFVRALSETLKYSYGKKDRVTQRRIPFLQLFRSRYNLKLKTANQDLWKSQDTDQTKFRKAHVAQFLQDLAKAKGLSKDELKSRLSFNALNHEKCMEFLQDIQASPQEIEEYQAISNKSYTESLEYNLQSAKGGSSVSTKVLQQSLSSFTKRERQAMVILDLLDAAKEKMKAHKQQKILALFLPYFITLKVIGVYAYTLHECVLWQPYMDMPFWQYCKAYWQMDKQKGNEILGQYLSQKPDTVRKKLSIVQTFLVKVQAGK